jgi:hypothetical protein
MALFKEHVVFWQKNGLISGGWGSTPTGDSSIAVVLEASTWCEHFPL